MGEGAEVIRPSSELSGFVRVEKQLSIAFRISERSPKLGVVVGYDVFRVLVQDRGRGGGCSGLFLPLPGWGGAFSWLGLGRGADPCRRGGAGAVTRWDRSRIADWRVEGS